MTFQELMKFVTHDQKVRLRIVDTEDEIAGKADTLGNYVCDELAKTQVAEINVEQGVLNVMCRRMKTPDEIKKGLEHCSEDGCKGCNYEDDCNMADGFSVLAFDALSYINQLEAQVPKWISVNERLPGVSDVVFVIASGQPRPNVKLRNASLIASYWGDEGWIVDGYEDWDSGHISVSHWMPLPEAPKEG